AAGKIDALSMIQSNFSSPPNPDMPAPSPGPGNLEVIARMGDRLAHFWMEDAPPHRWRGPLFLPNVLPSGVAHLSGNPSLIQSTSGKKGNFELVVPLADKGMAFYYRDNDEPSLRWNGPFVFGTEVGHVEAVSLIQSNFGRVGDLQLVARTNAGLQFFWRSDESKQWAGPALIHDSANTIGIPSLIQGTYGDIGNFELVAPLANGGLAHYWRDNDNTALPWNGPDIFGTEAGKFEYVSLMQSNYGNSGNLELVAQ